MDRYTAGPPRSSVYGRGSPSERLSEEERNSALTSGQSRLSQTGIATQKGRYMLVLRLSLTRTPMSATSPANLYRQRRIAAELPGCRRARYRPSCPYGGNGAEGAQRGPVPPRWP